MRLRQRVIQLALAAMLLSLSFPAEAQQPKKAPRIGYLSVYEPTTESARIESFRRALQELGYIEGQSIFIEYRYAEGKRDRYPELAAEMVRLKVDVIVLSGGLLPIQATKNATKTIPIVMTGIGADPVKTGLIESLARPGGNVTGITNLETYLGGKRLELLKESAPAMTDALAKLLIEKGVITDAEFKQKLLEERAVYQRILNPTTQ